MSRLYDSIRCRDEGRRATLKAAAQQGTLNGIDTVEVEKDNQTTLHVFFLEGVPGGLNHRADLVSLTGGERVTNIRVLDTVRKAGQDPHLDVLVDVAGDFSTYTLTINSAKLDPLFAWAEFSFKAGCPSPFDCPGEPLCIVPPEPDPLIDYDAKDYLSFRRALLDWVSARYPNWLERSEADLGITLLDLLAYAGDQLSDYQDRVANEMYLGTARRRLSVKRHSALIDYELHEGANAHTFLYIKVNSDGVMPAGTQVTTVDEPGVAPIVFETDEQVSLYTDHNEFQLYTWSNAECCLPAGATAVYLLGWHPHLESGQYLLFEEAKSPVTGIPADANRSRRQVVKLTGVEKTTDPLGGQKLTRITWHAAGALTQQFCLSTVCADGSTLSDVTVACANIVPASHGETHTQTDTGPAVTQVDGTLCKPLPVPAPEPYHFELIEAPLTFTTTSGDVRDALSTVKVSIPPTGQWHERRTLVQSGEFAQHFVVDVDEEGRATVRFGDGVYGRAVPPGATINVTYRVGNGTAGNVGAESLTHLPTPLSFVDTVTNPLPASGGIDPEPVVDVKRLAPQAFHAIKLRAVTAADYAGAAEKVSGVQHARARFRWTGSWHTVFVSIDPIGHESLTAELKEKVQAQLDAYRMAGYDLEIRPPVYVPLDIEANICVEKEHFRADVLKALLEALSAGILPDGRRGFFHPDNFSFGDPLYLSRLYQAIERVEGVQSAEVITFKRWSKAAAGELARGEIAMSDSEIVRLDNDPSAQEHGRLVLHMLGGK